MGWPSAWPGGRWHFFKVLGAVAALGIGAFVYDFVVFVQPDFEGGTGGKGAGNGLGIALGFFSLLQWLRPWRGSFPGLRSML
ncbi:hypothetical protein RA19_22600 [Leisingera sp. ANG-M1]|nr:hypothetical protein RA19_22600 [Leisingera sp. ANG-M1]